MRGGGGEPHALRRRRSPRPRVCVIAGLSPVAASGAPPCLLVLSERGATRRYLRDEVEIASVILRDCFILLRIGLDFRFIVRTESWADEEGGRAVPLGRAPSELSARCCCPFAAAVRSLLSSEEKPKRGP